MELPIEEKREGRVFARGNKTRCGQAKKRIGPLCSAHPSAQKK